MRKTESGSSYLLDTSAVIALWAGEDGAGDVEAIFRGGTPIYVSFMTLMEGKYRIWRKAGRPAADEFARSLELLPITRIDVTDEILNLAAEIKATNALSVADSWIIASAVSTQSILVHKDPEFEQVKGRVEMFALPYKRKK